MSSIKCGNCTSTHESVAAVRNCYAQGKALGAAPLTRTATRAATETPVPAATERQQSFLASLRSERGLEPLAFTGSRKQASDEIARLLNMPKVQVATDGTATSSAPASQPDVPAGRYAIEVEGTVKFYRVDRPTEGRWSGRTFVKVQASDNLYPVRGASANVVLENIAKDPKEAMLRYGRALGQCGHCGRTLTNEDSRAVGIGPICSRRMGF